MRYDNQEENISKNTNVGRPNKYSDSLVLGILASTMSKQETAKILSCGSGNLPHWENRVSKAIESARDW